MSTEPRGTFLARLARRPLPVFLGLAVGFLGCCIAGRVAARQQPYKKFVRFHQGISAEAHHYPTYSQTLNLARQHVKPGKVLVVLSGDSVLHGVGQRPTHVWTLRLQELLGDEYVVLNLATRAGVPAEYGSLVAEQLLAEGVPVVMVCRGNHVDWDGYFYRYVFWDAWGKGRVRPDPRRDAWLAEFGTKYAKDEKGLEARHRGRVDAVSYAPDLWNLVSYKYRATVWTPLRYPKFWRPYRDAPDNDPGALAQAVFEARFNPAPDSVELGILRAYVNSPLTDVLLRGEQYEAIGALYAAFIPDSLRDRSLYVFRMENPFYRARLTPEERAKYEEVSRRYPDATRRVGLAAAVVGENYVPGDYVDLSHLSEQGGRKLAEDLAPAIRAMSERLNGAKPAAGGKP